MRAKLVARVVNLLYVAFGLWLLQVWVSVVPYLPAFVSVSLVSGTDMLIPSSYIRFWVLPLLFLVTIIFLSACLKRLPVTCVWPRLIVSLLQILLSVLLVVLVAIFAFVEVRVLVHAAPGVLVLVLVPLAWWWLPRVLAASGPKGAGLTVEERAELVERTRGTVAQALALLLLVVVAVPLVNLAGIRQERVAAARQYRQAVSTQATERFAVAEALLRAGGSENLMRRLGGIYLLERIASTPTYYRRAMVMLAAYVRRNAPIQGKAGPNAANISPPAPDIEAILTVIGRGVQPWYAVPFRRLDMRSVDLRKANLMNVRLRQVRLSDSELREANMTGASLDSVELFKMDLSLCRLSGAKLTGADLTAAVLRKADLKQAKLSEADLSEADLSGADLTKACLTGSRLRGANLCGANLRAADLSMAIGLTQAALDGTYTDEHTRVSPPLVAGNKRANRQ